MVLQRPRESDRKHVRSRHHRHNFEHGPSWPLQEPSKLQELFRPDYRWRNGGERESSGTVVREEASQREQKSPERKSVIYVPFFRRRLASPRVFLTPTL